MIRPRTTFQPALATSTGTIAAAPTTMRVLDDAQLEEADGGFLPILIGVAVGAAILLYASDAG